MSNKGETNWFVSFLFFLVSAIIGGVSEKFINGTLKDQSLISHLSIILVLVVLVSTISYLIHLNKKIKGSIVYIQKEFLSLFKDRFYCSFFENQDDRHQKMIQCIRNAEKQIYIFSDLADSDEILKPGHKEYLKTLNEVLEMKKKDIKFKRIVVPNPKKKIGESEQDVINWVKNNDAYSEHLKIVNKYQTKPVVALKKEHPVGLSFLLVDDHFLFLVIEKEYNETVLGTLLEGGFYFEDFGNKLTKNFKECMDDMAIGNIVVT